MPRTREENAADLASEQAAAENHPLIELLWDYMKRDPEHRDRVRTAWGTKTKQGLVASIKRIMEEHSDGTED